MISRSSLKNEIWLRATIVLVCDIVNTTMALAHWRIGCDAGFHKGDLGKSVAVLCDGGYLSIYAKVVC